MSVGRADDLVTIPVLADTLESCSMSSQHNLSDPLLTVASHQVVRLKQALALCAQCPFHDMWISVVVTECLHSSTGVKVLMRKAMQCIY